MEKSERSAVSRCASRARRSESGVATVEFALILPLLLILVLGTATLCHAFIMRFLMHSAAYDAARACALEKPFNTGCPAKIVSEKLKNVKMACDGPMGPYIDPPPAWGLQGVNVLAVRLECNFIGGVGAGYLKKQGWKIATITARAAMPY